MQRTLHNFGKMGYRAITAALDFSIEVQGQQKTEK